MITKLQDKQLHLLSLLLMRLCMALPRVAVWWSLLCSFGSLCGRYLMQDSVCTGIWRHQFGHVVTSWTCHQPKA